MAVERLAEATNPTTCQRIGDSLSKINGSYLPPGIPSDSNITLADVVQCAGLAAIKPLVDENVGDAVKVLYGSELVGFHAPVR
jgi:hypothetical protein